MNKNIIWMFSVAFIVFLSIGCSRSTQTSIFKNPPKRQAKIFAPNLIGSSDKEHGKLTVAPDMKSIFWDVVKLPFTEGDVQKTVFIKKNGLWGKREIAEFSGKYRTWSPCFCGDDKLLFGTMKENSTGEVVSDYWIIEKQDDSWKNPRALGFDGFSNTSKWTFSVAGNGNIYFDDRNFQKGQYQWGMYVSYYENNGYSPPVLLPEKINTEFFDWTPFVDPRESFLLFASNRPGSMGSTDIYVSFKNSEGSWSEPVNLGEGVNSSDLERWPSLSPDGKILFFQRDYIVDDKLNEQDYYWIDAKIIEDLRPK